MDTLYVDPRKKKFRTLNVNTNDYKWCDTRLEFTQSFKNGFDISYSNDHPDYEIIIRPTRMYLSNDFESIFGLGYGCSGFNKDIVVAIIN